MTLNSNMARGRRVRQSKLLFFAKAGLLWPSLALAWSRLPPAFCQRICLSARNRDTAAEGVLFGPSKLMHHVQSCRPCHAAMHVGHAMKLNPEDWISHVQLAEKGLQTYERDGWSEFNTQIVPERREIRPTADRGPILLCVDTSGSMRGARETVAKALALECMRAARAQVTLTNADLLSDSFEACNSCWSDSECQGARSTVPALRSSLLSA